MERIENLTMEQLEAASKVSEKDGYQETVSIENVPAGAVTANLIVGKIKENGKSVNSPMFALIKFERKDKEGNELKLKFEAIKLNVLHLSTGKTFNGIYAKVTEDLKTVLRKPENWGKSLNFESTPYKDSAGRDRTILKFESVDK